MERRKVDDQLLSELRAKAEAAIRIAPEYYSEQQATEMVLDVYGRVEADTDGPFIAAASPAVILALVEEVERLRDQYFAQDALRGAAQDEVRRLRQVAELREEEITKAEDERDNLRKALITVGRNTGASLSDTVSTEFLLLVPEEVRLVMNRLRQVARYEADVAAAEIEGRKKAEAERDQLHSANLRLLGEVSALTAELAEVKAALRDFADCVLIDAKMDGPQVRGVKVVQMTHAWRACAQVLNAAFSAAGKPPSHGADCSDNPVEGGR